MFVGDFDSGDGRDDLGRECSGPGLGRAESGHRAVLDARARFLRQRQPPFIEFLLAVRVLCHGVSEPETVAEISHKYPCNNGVLYIEGGRVSDRKRIALVYELRHERRHERGLAIPR